MTRAQREANARYWKERTIQNDARTEAEKAVAIQKLEEIFNRTIEQMERDIDRFYRQYANEEGIVTAADARRMLSPNEMDVMRRKFAELSKIAKTESERKYLEQLRLRLRISRQEMLLAEIRHYATELTSTWDVSMQTSLEGIFRSSEAHQWYNIEQYTGYAIAYEKLSPSQMQALIHQGWDGRNYSSKIWYDRDRLVRVVEQLVPQQFILGRSSEDLAKQLAKSMKTSLNNAKALIRTEGTNMSAQADKILYKDIGINLYEFFATIDNVTSQECRDMDGYTFPISQAKVGVNFPPLHTNCRSTTLPVVDMEGLTELRLVKGDDGKYIKIPKMSYRAWERTR